MLWASRNITVIWKRRFNEHSMSDSVFHNTALATQGQLKSTQDEQ